MLALAAAKPPEPLELPELVLVAEPELALVAEPELALVAEPEPAAELELDFELLPHAARTATNANATHGAHMNRKRPS
jgi:hypothetical protein